LNNQVKNDLIIREMPISVNYEKLAKFCENVFGKLGVSPDDAQITTKVLLAADLRGVDSHGVARLWRYVDGLQRKTIDAIAAPTIERESPATAAIDAHDGLGQPASFFAMNLVIQKAAESGVGIATVKNSNHFGIAGFYSMLALERNFLGICLTNANPLVIPTFGRSSVFGTNPISIAAPAKNEKPFVLDMATSTVPRGKLEVFHRKEMKMPHGWAVDTEGESTEDAGLVLDNLLNRTGGGLTPLGGVGELFGGHKGFGLSFAVDILTGVLSGAAYSTFVGADKNKPANVGHFFAAIDIAKFIDPEQFRSRLDKYIALLHNSKKAKNEKRIFIHGEKSFERAAERRKNGIPLQEKVFANLAEIGTELGVPFAIEI
jgi:LDH2 family malate/lactate/ureidoglycolate dehydrogenase